jgi:hypothetical protein
VFADEDAFRRWLVESMFEFMTPDTCFFPLPCRQCNGLHVVSLPTKGEPEKRDRELKS